MKPEKEPTPLTREPTLMGYCPVCGAKGLSRERRPNGNDRCENGHSYSSKDAQGPFVGFQGLQEAEDKFHRNQDEESDRLGVPRVKRGSF